jgi:DNA mismatch endonuclease (patch repair protein)
VVDAWKSTVAGAHLAGRSKVNTAPELALRRAVHALGGRFRLHPRLARGCTPDFVLPRRKVAVFVDGCFWHSCPVHGRSKPFSGPNADLWARKLERNRVRDVAATAKAEALGWTVVRVWECEVQRDPVALARLVMSGSSAGSDFESRPAAQCHPGAG